MIATGRCTAVVLISGRGSNLQSLIDATEAGDLPLQILQVVSNRPKAIGLERARRHGISTAVIDHRDYRSRHDFDRALTTQVAALQPKLIVLAGFMRILGAEFIGTFEGRILNIHPSLLPAFPGLHTHQRALQAGVREHGATVHFVTEGLDSGPTVLQAVVPVHDRDDEDSLAARVLTQEHRIYVQAVRWFCEGRLRMYRGRALLDDTPLDMERIKNEFDALPPAGDSG